jgi:hypothetical protein
LGKTETIKIEKTSDGLDGEETLATGWTITFFQNSGKDRASDCVTKGNQKKIFVM